VNHKRAFTLIELLVVIAIIAILAAILFPVFAQAKLAAKKTQTLAQFKQTGLAANIYITDADDVFPLSMSYDSLAAGGVGAWRTGSYTGVPNGWTSTAARDVEPRKSEEGTMVFNSIQPYTKNLGVYEGAGLIDFNPGFTQSLVVGAPKPAKCNLTFNGLLHAWSATAINQPSKLPLMLENYKQNTIGGQISNPVLCCTNTGPDCRFNPGGYPQGGQVSCAYYGPGYGYVWFLSTAAANFTVWVYGRGMPFVASDTSARMVQFNAPVWPLYAQNVNASPWSAFDPAGVPGSPYWMTDCVAPGGTKPNPIYYAGYFRPDSQYDYTLNQCDFGGG
jgi:prepilin-type N-terminal cleavage/methylation domain-containing protein